MTMQINLDELRNRLLAIGFRMVESPPPFNKMFIHPPWGGLPYRLRDISDEDLLRWESGQQDEPVYEQEP